MSYLPHLLGLEVSTNECNELYQVCLIRKSFRKCALVVCLQEQGGYTDEQETRHFSLL